jgi:hypothetical protein
MEKHGGIMLTGKLLIHPPVLSGNTTSSHLVASRRNAQKEKEFGLVKYFCSYLQVIFRIP